MMRADQNKGKQPAPPMGQTTKIIEHRVFGFDVAEDEQSGIRTLIIYEPGGVQQRYPFLPDNAVKVGRALSGQNVQVPQIAVPGNNGSH